MAVQAPEKTYIEVIIENVLRETIYLPEDALREHKDELEREAYHLAFKATEKHLLEVMENCHNYTISELEDKAGTFNDGYQAGYLAAKKSSQ